MGVEQEVPLGDMSTGAHHTEDATYVDAYADAGMMGVGGDVSPPVRRCAPPPAFVYLRLPATVS